MNRPLDRARLHRLLSERGPLALLLVATAVFYAWNITVNQMGNSFYAASAWAGSQSWKALLFGSLDPGDSITVDKPPVSQWVMGLSGKIFGFSSASMLIPQVLMGVLSVALLYGAVHRVAGRTAGLIAGSLLALTPVAALMFRYNNPDAAMVTLMIVGAYCTVRAVQGKGGRWLALAGVALGFAFLAKMLEGLMVLPALGLAYLIAAPVTVGKRIAHLLGAAAALVVSAGWYVVLTILWPADSRPYIAGSTDNSFMNLVFGYNGFGRLLGDHNGGGGWGSRPADCPVPEFVTQMRERMAHHHGGFGPFGADPGLSRLFTGEWGFEISFLLPAALSALVLALISRGRAPRSDLMRVGLIVFGGWMLVDGLVLAEMKRAASYYSLSMAPAVAATLALGAIEMWRRRDRWTGRAGLAVLVALGGGWGFVLLSRDTSFAPAMRWIVLVAAVAAVLIVLIPGRRIANARSRTALVAVGLASAAVAVVGGSAAYAVAAVADSHAGPGLVIRPDAGFGGGFGLNTPNADVDALLAKTDTRWAAAVNGSMQAAALELNTHKSVIAVGGFTSQDPSPNLAQFQGYVRGHEVSYFIVAPNRWGGGDAATDQQDTNPECNIGFGGGGNSTTDQVTAWVQKYFTPVTVGGMTVYDVTNPPPAALGTQ